MSGLAETSYRRVATNLPGNSFPTFTRIYLCYIDLNGLLKVQEKLDLRIKEDKVITSRRTTVLVVESNRRRNGSIHPFATAPARRRRACSSMQPQSVLHPSLRSALDRPARVIVSPSFISARRSRLQDVVPCYSHTDITFVIAMCKC